MRRLDCPKIKLISSIHLIYHSVRVGLDFFVLGIPEHGVQATIEHLTDLFLGSRCEESLIGVGRDEDSQHEELAKCDIVIDFIEAAFPKLK